MLTPHGHRKRRKRYDRPGHAHYLTFSCFRSQPFLRSERASLWLIEGIAAAKAKHPFDLWAWVFMPNHVHLLLRPQAGTDMKDLLRAIKEPISKRVSYWVRTNAPGFVPRMLDVRSDGRRCLRFWQCGGGYDRNIISATEVREKIGYIHKNPLRAGLVADPKDWKWSSFLAWESGVNEPLPIDRETVPPLEP